VHNEVGFGIVALDHWYSALPFAEAFEGATRARLAAIADGGLPRGAPIARAAGAELLSDYRPLLERADVDVIACFASTDKNAAICREAASAGKHIIAVKPMAMTLREADEVVDAVRRAGVLYFPTEATRRLSRLLGQMRAWIGEGRIGRPLHLLLTGRAGLPVAWPDSDARGWWTNPAKAPGGAWLDHAIYSVDAARWLLEAEVSAVAGATARVKYPDLGLEDYGIGSLRMTTGQMVVIEDTWTLPEAGLQYVYQIVGTEGVLSADMTSGQVWFGRRGGAPAESVAVPSPRAQPNLPDYIAGCVREHHPPGSNADGARANLAACLAFYEAAATGRPTRPA
jgi:predicted dehydrogenase